MNITKNRKIWLSVSGTLVAISIALPLILGLNLGLDFLGGIRWNVQFKDQQAVSVEKISDFFAKQELEKSVQIQSATKGQYLITLENVPEEKFTTISSGMQREVGAFEEVTFRRVDPTLGNHFKNKAFYAIIAALIGIILFVAIAFRKIPKSISPWRFGAVSIIALFHDILIILGVFTVLGVVMDVELDLQFIVAILATLGFSVNDTIVILDRVRENIAQQKAKETFEEIIEKSVQQTMQRSINTSLSTLLPLLGLLFFGADAIFYFMLALAIGITVGTYSSIFLAAPMLVIWKNLTDKKRL
jgi:preprotein translocase subunit SecF